jgi:general secretion pathway protein G
MNYSRNRYRTRTAGFSLIEVLIVVVVLGIIMSIVVSTLVRARDKARQGATIADMRNLCTAIEAYTVDYSLPPDTSVFTDVAQLLKPYHNQRVPVNDHWGHAYEYARTDIQTYSLTSFGKDGIDGPELTPSTRFEFNRDIVVANGEFPGLP